MQRPIAADKLFVPGFRPADKLVWNGSAFEVAPAGQMAYMTHPQTGRRIMVGEPASTNIITNSSDFSAGWSGSVAFTVVEVPGILPGKPGYRFTRNAADSGGITRSAGVVPAGAQTMHVLASRADCDRFTFGIRDVTNNGWIGYAEFSWAAGQVTILSQSAGQSVSAGVIQLTDSDCIVWVTATALESGGGRVLYIYPAPDGEGISTTFFNVQLEETPYWTSPIVTGETALTRAADVLRIDDYDQKVIGADSSGSMFIEYEYPMEILDSNSYFLFAETVDGASFSRQMIYPVGTATRARAHLYQNGTPSFATANNGGALGVIKAGASFSASELAIALSGVGASDINATGLIAGINRAAVSSVGAGTVSRPLWITKITRDHVVRTAAQLEEMTS